ncbi:hypothetical protein Bca52824_024495 [Brassica carinata]|uniref:Uncharacterized protein n=1 Tax=Brassica carinata TaxID=52824 RepID=A0A8X8AVU7_BRACI|nr:hypothetical protein Bca52824_024495 [Brassica carinata]
MAKDEKDEKAPPPAKVSPKVGMIHDLIGELEMRWDTDSLNQFLVLARTIKTEVVLPEKVEVAAVSAIDDNDKYKDYTESCSISYAAFQECLNVEGNKLSKCHVFMDSLFE